MRKLHKFWLLPLRDKVRLPLVAAELAWVRRRIVAAGVRGLTPPPRRPASARFAETGHEARRLARLVNAAAAALPGTFNCLPRAVTLSRLLSRSGISSELRIGVQKADEVFGAHAWVEVDGLVLIGGEDAHEKYTVLPGAIGN